MGGYDWPHGRGDLGEQQQPGEALLGSHVLPSSSG